MPVTGLDGLRERLAAFLEERGVHAVTAWSPQPARDHRAPVAAVALKQVEGDGLGFQNYLGVRYNPEAGAWEELYGRRLRLVFGLDLYVPKEQGGEGCQRAFAGLAQALTGEEPRGLSLGRLSCGEAEFHRESGMFRCPAELEAQAGMYAAAAQDGGLLLDFDVKGERT